jgi:hypothetical protein
MRRPFSRRLRSNERGGALLEMAISIPIFIAMMALILDVGLGFGAARNASSATRSAARSAALAGDDRLADFRALDAVRAEFSNTGDQVVQVTIYRSPALGNGLVPGGCALGGGSIGGLCNVYPGAMLDTLNSTQFQDPLCAGEPDLSWCPTSREANDGDYLGVSVWTTHQQTVGIINADDIELEDRSVFALFFPDPPTLAAP